MKLFIYRFYGNGKEELREINSALLTNADRIALKISKKLSKEWCCRVYFSGPCNIKEDL
ncbi:MAG: hypothetical protein ACFFDH_12775 [Promethearchaeota archaeon]